MVVVLRQLDEFIVLEIFPGTWSGTNWLRGRLLCSHVSLEETSTGSEAGMPWPRRLQWTGL